MSHRALVAVTREDGRYDVHYSHDGGADDRLKRLLPPGVDPPSALVDGAPIARGADFEGLLADHLDPIEHEALLVVGSDGEVVPFVVLPYLLATADGLIEWDVRGVALALSGRDGSSLDPAFVRGWFQGVAGVLGEVIDAGLLSPDEAFGWLDESVRRLAGDRHTFAVVP